MLRFLGSECYFAWKLHIFLQRDFFLLLPPFGVLLFPCHDECMHFSIDVVSGLTQALTLPPGAVVDIYVGYGLDTNRFVLRALSIIVPDITIYFVLLFFSQVLAHSRDQVWSQKS